MIINLMIRYSQLSKISLQARYVINHKKPVVSMPSKTPPKYVYEVTYHPSSRPGLDLGYPDHQHLNPFAELAGNKHEQFRYSYAGQWWEEYFFAKLLAAFSPAIFAFLFWYTSKDNAKTKKQDCFSTVTLDFLLDRGFPAHAV